MSNKTNAAYHPYSNAGDAARARMTNPDCINGKHANCWGDGWDEVNDVSAPCPCQCHPDIQP